MGITYKDAGVDVEAGYEAVRLMSRHVLSTHNDKVLKGLANFGGLYSLGGEPEKVLVAGADGVGTKLKIAFLLNKHDTVGIDCVAMCANDVVCHGAAPLFFLDYIATGRIKPENVAEIVKGVADGCKQAGCALLGGETAEMPGFYSNDEYDLAGFCVGIVDRDKLIDGSRVQKGDTIVGLASSGMHSNGFSLVRKLFKMDSPTLNSFIHSLNEKLGDELLKPTRIYVKTVLELAKSFDIRGIAHITGGGFIENIPRILPDRLCARIKLGSWPVHPVFDMLQEQSDINTESAFNTFNMGIGMALAVPAEQAQSLVSKAVALGEKAYIIGRVVEGRKGVELCK